MDLAVIGLEARSDGIVKAVANLDKLSGAAKKAQTAADGLAGSAKKADAANDALASSATAATTSQNAEAAALSKTAQAANVSANAATALAKAQNATAMQARMLSFQLNDVFTMIASGQAPLMTAVQQTSQFTQVLNTMGGRKNIIAGLGAAFTQVLNPISLVTLATIALGGTFIQWMTGAGDSVKSLDDKFDELAKSVAAVDAASKPYSATGLADMAAKYGEVNSAVLTLIERQNELAQNTAMTNANTAIAALRDEYGGLLATIDAGGRAGQAAQQLVTNELKLTGAEAGRLRDAMNLAANAMTFGEKAAALATVNGILSQSALKTDDLYKKTVDAEDAMRQLAQSAPKANWLDAAVSGVKGLVGSIWESIGEQSNAAMKGMTDTVAARNLADLNSFANMNFGNATQSANAFSASIGNVGTSANSAVQQVISLQGNLAQSNLAGLTAMQKNGMELRNFQTELVNAKATIDRIAASPLKNIFGSGALAANARATADAAVTSINKIFGALDQGSITSRMAFEGLELIRSSLIQMGGDAQSVNRFVDQIVNGQIQVRGLTDIIRQLSAQILGIPDKTVNINVVTRSYTVPSGSGGMTGVNVHRPNGPINTGTTGGYGGSGGGTRDATAADWAFLTPADKEAIYWGRSNWWDLVDLRSGASSGVTPSGAMERMGYASGGYTGAGGKNDPAGIVHRGEYVFSQSAVNRIGVDNLEAMHKASKGYAGGGAVDGVVGGVFGSGTLAAIEENTAQTSDGMNRLIALTQTWSSDVLAMLRTLQASRSVNLGGSGSSGGTPVTSGQTGMLKSRPFDANKPLDRYSSGKEIAAAYGYNYLEVLKYYPDGTVTGPGADRATSGTGKGWYDRTRATSPFSEGPRSDMGAGYAKGGVIPASGPGSSDSQYIRFMKRPDEDVVIHTPQQREAIMASVANQYAKGIKDGTKSQTINFGDIVIKATGPIDPRSARAAADEFTQRVRASMSNLNG